MSEPIEQRVQVDQSLSHLMPLFFDNRRELLDEAQTCCTSGDLDRLRGIGHNFKGACGSYGFHQLSRFGEQLQYVDNLAEACDLVQQMRRHLDQVVVEYV